MIKFLNIWSLFVIVIADAVEACDIWYLREPVSFVQCNPYSEETKFDLVCAVQAPATAGPRLDIVWLFTNTSGHTVQINMNTGALPASIVTQNDTVMYGELIELISTMTLGQLSYPIHAGRYFCLVQIDGIPSSLSPSNAQIFIANSTVLNWNSCTSMERTTQFTTRCAGNLSSSMMSASESTNSYQTSSISSSRPVPPTSNATTLFIKLTTSSQLPPMNGQIMIGIYVVVSEVILFFVIVIILTILLIYFCLKKQCFHVASTRELRSTTVTTATNSAYGVSEFVKIDLNVAYADTSFIRDNANQEHTTDSEAGYVEIIL